MKNPTECWTYVAGSHGGEGTEVFRVSHLIDVA